jgi:hypothetical protein
MMGITIASASAGNALPVPSGKFSAQEICELILGKIGSFTINDESPNPVAMERTLQHLDMILAEIAGTEMCWWLIEDTYRFTWPENVRIDTIENVMGDAYPALGIVMPIAAYLVNAAGVRVDELDIVRRHEYESLSNRDLTGQPQKLYFSRAESIFSVSIYPVPDASFDGYVDLVAQTYAPSVLGMQHQTDQAGDLQHNFPVEWQRFLVNQGAADVGNGPVLQADLQYINSWQAVADGTRARLEAWSNREKKSKFSRTKRWGS